MCGGVFTRDAQLAHLIIKITSFIRSVPIDQSTGISCIVHTSTVVIGEILLPSGYRAQFRPIRLTPLRDRIGASVWYLKKVLEFTTIHGSA